MVLQRRLFVPGIEEIWLLLSILGLRCLGRRRKLGVAVFGWRVCCWDGGGDVCRILERLLLSRNSRLRINLLRLVLHLFVEIKDWKFKFSLTFDFLGSI